MATKSNVDIILRVQDEASSKLKQAASEMGGFAGSIQRLSRGLGPVGLMATGIATLGAAATANSLQLANQVEQLDNLSLSLGIGARELQVIQFAFKQGGVDAAAFAQSMDFLRRAMASNDPVLNKLGVTSEDSFQAFMQAARGLATMGDGAERAKLTHEMFGRGGRQLIPILLELANNFGGVADEAERTGNVLGGADLDRLRTLDKDVDRLSAAFAGLKTRMGALFAGPTSAAVSGINAYIDSLLKGNKILEEQAARRKAANQDADTRALGLTPGPSGDTGDDGLMTWGTRVISTPTPLTADEIKAKAKAAKEFADEVERLKRAERDEAGKGTFLLNQNRLPGPTQKIDVSLADTKPVEQSEANDRRIIESAQRMQQAVTSAAYGLQSTWMSVLMNITNKSQTFQGAITTIFNGTRDAVLQALMEIVSSQIVAGFLKLLGMALTALGLPGAGFLTTAAGNVAGQRLTASLPSAPPVMATAGGGGDTYYVSIPTINSKSVYQSLTNGEFRRANSRLNEIAAAS